MAADFWAGYISGAVGIIVGNPLDMLKVRLQASPNPPFSPSPTPSYLRPWMSGTAAPVLGYGALNALLFVSYNRTEGALNRALHIAGGTGTNLWTTWLAGAAGGLATWVVSTPTELVKCRAQLASPPLSSWAIARQVLRVEGVRGLYCGGVVTALRDSVGYGFYFWSYELGTRLVENLDGQADPDAPAGQGGGVPNPRLLGREAAKVLLCGGIAGVITWASIFPLDVIKTRVQAQILHRRTSGAGNERSSLLEGEAQRRPHEPKKRLGAWCIAQETYREGGVQSFLRGLTVCSIRAFVVNAVQWAIYEWIMIELGHGRTRDGSRETSIQVIAP